MKPLAGGPARARHARFRRTTGSPTAPLASMPRDRAAPTCSRSRRVAAVVPGIASIEEAEEDARAGHAPSRPRRSAPAAVAAAPRRRCGSTLCSRCGDCEPTCSRGLPISSMFRDAYIWSYAQRDVHGRRPRELLRCSIRIRRSPARRAPTDRALCPQGLDVPRALAAFTSGCTRSRPAGAIRGRRRACAGDDRRRRRLLVQSARSAVDGWRRATAGPLPGGATRRCDSGSRRSTPRASTASALASRRRRLAGRPCRCARPSAPASVSPVVFEFDGAARPGARITSTFRCMPLEWRPALDARPTPFFSTARVSSRGTRPPYGGAGCVEHTVPGRTRARGDTYGVRVTLDNGGRLPWRGRDPATGRGARLRATACSTRRCRCRTATSRRASA